MESVDYTLAAANNDQGKDPDVEVIVDTENHQGGPGAGDGGDNADGQAKPDAGSGKKDVDTQDPEVGATLSKILGEKYTDPASVIKLIERGESYSDVVEQELVTLRTENSNIKEQINSVQKYKNPNYARLEKLEETDPDNVDIYRKIMFSKNPDPMELVRWKTLADNKDVFGEDEEALDLYMQDKYPAIFDEDIPPDDPRYKRDMTKLKIDANLAKKSFQEKIDAIPVEDHVSKTQAAQAAREKLISDWKAPLGTLQTQLKSIPVMVNDKDGKPAGNLLEIELSPEQTKSLMDMASNVVLQGNLEPSDKSMEYVKSFLYSMWIAKNQAAYNTAIAEKISKNKDQDWRQHVHNSGDKKRKADASAASIPFDDVLMEQMRKDGQIF